MKVSEQIAIMKAYEDGKTIEQKSFNFDGTDWESIVYVEDYPFDFVSNEYRIKPECKYRPYESVDEAFNEAEKHGFWVKSKDKHSLFFIDSFEAAGNGDIYIGHCHVGAFIEKFIWFDDCSPCGVKIN
ncbi:MAG: hypothetical protein SPH99_01265 [Sodaliphilus sp.]|nr:hypothetical protein [Sodaliphilus sp.]